jgi:uncharacterized membrane protein
MTLFIKILVIVLLLVIFGSLASALVYLIKDRDGGKRTARALTVRIVLSISLFLLLMAGFYFGIIPQEGL